MEKYKLEKEIAEHEISRSFHTKMKKVRKNLKEGQTFFKKKIRKKERIEKGKASCRIFNKIKFSFALEETKEAKIIGK